VPGPDIRDVSPRRGRQEYQLTIIRAGFLEERYRLTLKPREALNMTSELALRPIAESIEVSAEANAVPTIHSPSSTLLPSERMEDLPLAQRTNLTDAIVASTPGMIRGHDDFVHIRGHEVALNPFINGVSFWENVHSVFSPGIGADFIESMNVMTGGFSAEYGNRFGGVLDVVTKSGFTMNNSGSITLGLGTALRHNAGIEFGGHTGRAAYYVNVVGFESGRFLSPPDPRSIHNTGRGARSFLQLDFNANPRNFLKEHFTQNLTLGWDAPFTGDVPRLTFQFNIENLSDNVYLISKESTFVQGQYSIPRLISGSIKFRF